MVVRSNILLMAILDVIYITSSGMFKARGTVGKKYDPSDVGMDHNPSDFGLWKSDDDWPCPGDVVKNEYNRYYTILNVTEGIPIDTDGTLYQPSLTVIEYGRDPAAADTPSEYMEWGKWLSTGETYNHITEDDIEIKTIAEGTFSPRVMISIPGLKKDSFSFSVDQMQDLKFAGLDISDVLMGKCVEMYGEALGMMVYNRFLSLRK